ncbi:MAG: GNAT family N-acetyltransferase [Gordonia sp. (in: high G+C Gram-positive bacteria)]|uniref:GNAT family N-acetyltransferase n=1 Tax=Gordonia sp. (in: high G+C Gram-positive bacteria) TaxID=84139 RepID=UPI0039E53741
MIVDTARLWLRPVLPEDVDSLVHLDSDPEVMRFVNGGAPTPRSRVADWTIPRARAEHAAHGTGVWTLIDKSTGEFVGWVSLRRPRHSPRTEVELSYRLQRRMWGRGMATEAAAAIVDLALTTHRAERVFAGVAPANIASRRVLTKIGMRPAAESSSPDVVEYEILRAGTGRRHGSPAALPGA